VNAGARHHARGDAIVVNGDPQPLAAGATIVRLLELLEVGADARGVAVAVEGEVIPRGQWQTRTLAPGERVEVVRAVQGG
jgi:sulfur carrier protein